MVDDEANELAWVILAVDRFGSVGNRVEAGEKLVKAKIIEPAPHGFTLTPKGEKLAARITRSRGGGR